MWVHGNLNGKNFKMSPKADRHKLEHWMHPEHWSVQVCIRKCSVHIRVKCQISTCRWGYVTNEKNSISPPNSDHLLLKGNCRTGNVLSSDYRMPPHRMRHLPFSCWQCGHWFEKECHCPWMATSRPENMNAHEDKLMSILHKQIDTPITPPFDAVGLLLICNVLSTSYNPKSN